MLWQEEDEVLSMLNIDPAVLVAVENLIKAGLTVGAASLLGNWLGVDGWDHLSLQAGPITLGLESCIPLVGAGLSTLADHQGSRDCTAVSVCVHLISMPAPHLPFTASGP